MSTVDPDEWIHGMLGPVCSKLCHADSEPQLPASAMIAQAIKEVGFDTANFPGYSIFNIRGDGPAGNANGFRKYNDLESACQDYISNMKKGYYDSALALLKPKLDDDTDEDVLNYIKTVIPIYAPPSENDCQAYFSDVCQFINEYNLRKYDNSANANKPLDPALVAKLGAQIQSGGGPDISGCTVGYGFQMKPVGSDHVRITKLPLGKTNPCEPIYPDLITVSDTVPQWVLDATIVEANKKAEEEYKKGQQSGSDEAKELEEDKKDAEAYAKFKEDQFVKWLTDNGHGYNSAETLKQCQEMYAAAAAADDGKAFLNGVYFGKDEAVKKKAQEFQEREKKRKEKLEEKESSKKDEKTKEGDKSKDGGESKDQGKTGGTEKGSAGKSDGASKGTSGSAGESK